MNRFFPMLFLCSPASDFLEPDAWSPKVRANCPNELSPQVSDETRQAICDMLLRVRELALDAKMVFLAGLIDIAAMEAAIGDREPLQQATMRLAHSSALH